MKKMFLENLPRWEDGSCNNGINWSRCVGRYVPFDYNGTKGDVFIKEYNIKSGKLLVQYKDSEQFISISNFTSCSLGKLLNKYTSEFRYEIGQVFKNDKRDLTITDREYRPKQYIKSNGKTFISNYKYYKYTCNKCGWTEGWIVEGSLKSGAGCLCCRGLVVVPEINSIWTTDRWMVDLGVSEEDAKRYTHGSSKKIKVICPDCGERKEMVVSSIYKENSIACTCKDGATYPERLMIAVLRQLNVDFKTQLTSTTFKWIGDRRYDFYLPKYNMIIETHGLQHYEQTRRKGARTLEEEKQNDKYKYELAMRNGIDKYIVIDCRESKLKWIKESILKSELANLVDLSKIDWTKCEKFALSNLIKEVCEYWNNKEEWETVIDLAKTFNLNDDTVRRYLGKGTELGWCYYNGQEELEKSKQRQKITRANPIEVYKDGKFLRVFSSSHEIDRNSLSTYGIKLHYAKICDAINTNKPYKGFTFKRCN